MKIKELLPKIGIYVVLTLLVLMLTTFAIGALFATGLFENEYINSLENVTYKFDNVPLNLLFLIVGASIIYGITKLIKNIKPKNIFIVILIIFIILSIAWIMFSKTPLKADQRIAEEVARKLISGDNTVYLKGSYMDYHPLQTSIVMFIEIIYRIAGQANPIIIKFLNVIFSSIMFLYLYKITDILFKKDRTKKIVSLLMIGCLPLIFWTTFVYGNIVGLMLGIIAIFYTLKYIEQKKMKYLIFMGIAIILSIILKSNYQIYLIGIVITLLLELFKKLEIKIIAVICCVLCLFAISNKVIVKIMEEKIGYEISDGIPMIAYIEMGLSKPYDRAAGWYNAKTDVEKIYRESEFDTEKASDGSKKRVIQRLEEMIKEPKETIIFFADKVASTWIEPTYQSIWINEPAEFVTENEDYFYNNKILISIYQGKAKKLIVKYLDIYQILVYSFVTIYVILNRKKITNKEACMLIIFIGGVFFHMIWETKSLYAIPFFILLLPYCAEGLEQIFTKVEEKIKKEKSKGE